MDGKIIGWIDIPQSYTRRESYEYAAWYAIVRVHAGRYPILRRGREGFSIPLKATVVEKYTQSHFGGVAMGKYIPPTEHPDVGKDHPASIWFMYERDFIRWVEEHATVTDEATRARIPVTVTLVGLSIGWERHWMAFTTKYPTPNTERYGEVPGGYRGYSFITKHLSPLRALPAASE